MLNEVAIHVSAFMQHQAVQDGVVAVHVHLWRTGGLGRARTLRALALVLPVGVGEGELVVEQILDHRLVVEACGEAEQRAAKVKKWVAVEKVAARTRGETGAMRNEQLEHRQVLVHDCEVGGHLAKV
jgi:hypothetical protein